MSPWMPLIVQWMSVVLANLQRTDGNGTERAMYLDRWGCESRRVCVETRVTNKEIYTAIESELAGGGRGPSVGFGLIAVFFYAQNWGRIGTPVSLDFPNVAWEIQSLCPLGHHQDVSIDASVDDAGDFVDVCRAAISGRRHQFSDHHQADAFHYVDRAPVFGSCNVAILGMLRVRSDLRGQ